MQFCTFCSSKNPEKGIYHGFHKNIKQHNCLQLWLKKIYPPNQHIRMFSEGSCDTEDWNNDAENSALPSQ